MGDTVTLDELARQVVAGKVLVEAGRERDGVLIEYTEVLPPEAEAVAQYAYQVRAISLDVPRPDAVAMARAALARAAERTNAPALK
jgi:hypothetical protein